MADNIVIQERERVVDVYREQPVARQQREENFCDILIKIAKVATPAFISIAAFALLPVEQAVVVTTLVVVVTLLYLFRNVGSSTAHSIYHSPMHTHRTIHHHHYDGGNSNPPIYNGGFHPSSFSSNNGGNMSISGFGFKAANPSKGEEGKGGNPSEKTEIKAGNPTPGIGGSRSSIESAALKSGIGASGSSASGSSRSGKSGIGASGSPTSGGSGGSKSGIGASGFPTSGGSRSGKSTYGSNT